MKVTHAFIIGRLGTEANGQDFVEVEGSFKPGHAAFFVEAIVDTIMERKGQCECEMCNKYIVVLDDVKKALDNHRKILQPGTDH